MNKSQLKRKIIIGSANFNQKYGKDSVKIKNLEIKKILNFSKKNKIYQIDTAESYLNKGSAFKNISKIYKFSTKVTPSNDWLSLEFCQKKLDDHFKNLNTNKIDTLFFHDIKILYSRNGIKIFNNLEKLKKKYFNKIGVSIYDTDCLNYITQNYNFDIVQCPYNILNKSFLTTGWFEKLKKKDIEIHIRSIFLQGLLVNKSIYKKKYFKKWKKKIYDWFVYLNNNHISPIDYCMSDLLYLDFDKVIIGINNYQNLKEILNFKKIDKNKFINLHINDKRLIDPRNWK